jgi:hypothetical protein
MSVRSIVEINHDFAGRIGERFILVLAQALSSSDPELWERLRREYGIRRIVECHHSDDRRVLVNGREHRA